MLDCFGLQRFDLINAGGSYYPELCTLLTKMICQDDHQVFGCLTVAITSFSGGQSETVRNRAQGHTRSLKKKDINLFFCKK